MKIVTWNCNGAFRNKIEPILQFDADIYIIQECEHTEQAKKIYRQYFSNFVWKGNNKNKGIGIFTKDALSLEVLDWQDNKLELFLPIQVNQSFTLLAVWAKHANSPTFAYIGQIWKYLQLHQLKMQNIPLIIGGDFNSNSQWDVWDRWWNHSDVIRIFNDLKIKSLYHHISNEKQGQESQATLDFLHKLFFNQFNSLSFTQSKLYMPASKLNRRFNRLRRFLYTQDKILKHFILPNTCST